MLVVGLSACSKMEPESTVDPLPLPPEIETNKDLSVKLGDSFFDYCNGTWLQTHPIPASGCIGGIYDMDAAMEQNVRQLKASVPDLTHYFDLMDHMHEQPEKSQAILCANASSFCFLGNDVFYAKQDYGPLINNLSTIPSSRSSIARQKPSPPSSTRSQ